jgi:hypothetical protein
MPLRDHFRSPINDITSWEGFYGGWPMMIVLAIQQKLPSNYVAAPRVHPRSYIEVDVGTFEKDEAPSGSWDAANGDGGIATAVWAPAQPTFAVATDLPDLDEYEVRVYDTDRGRRFVAAIEIVSPANKDRPEHRKAFVAKCAALLQKQVSVTIIDLVTTQHFNLFAKLLDMIAPDNHGLKIDRSPLYAVACRGVKDEKNSRVEAWIHGLVINKPLPTLPLWLSDTLAIPLELEPCYEETCRVLRIA